MMRRGKRVHLPHDFVVSGNFTNQNMSITPQPDHNPLLWSGSLPGGVGWYRKRFSLTESDQGKRIYIFFDGVFRESRFYLNQCYLGSHKSGYSIFYFGITDLAEFGGENLLTVRVDATLPEGWFYIAQRHSKQVYGDMVNT
jgi:beta-galactosidase